MGNLSKIYAMYLPQYHVIPENSEFWGEGFTDWVSVKKSEPQFKNHRQPRIPLDNNYYDLSNPDDVLWQVSLAKKYGIDGFAIYHYWFNNEKNLLTKPAEILLNQNIDGFNYFFTWDNISWKRTWSKITGNDWAPLQDNNSNKQEEKTLIEYILGEEKDWENHFNWCLKFFNDKKYEKIDNKPVFAILNYSNRIADMCAYWSNLAKKHGFNGMYFIYRYDKRKNIPINQNTYFYEPSQSAWDSFTKKVIHRFRLKFNIKKVEKFSYDKTYKKLIRNAKNNKEKNQNFGCFIDYDDTPRRGKKGSRCMIGGNPEKFEYYFSKLYEISNSQNKKFIFITAWNEWGEGAYLEPDTHFKYEYLNAVKKVKDKYIEKNVNKI